MTTPSPVDTVSPPPLRIAISWRCAARFAFRHARWPPAVSSSRDTTLAATGRSAATHPVAPGIWPSASDTPGAVIT